MWNLSKIQKCYSKNLHFFDRRDQKVVEELQLWFWELRSWLLEENGKLPVPFTNRYNLFAHQKNIQLNLIENSDIKL